MQHEDALRTHAAERYLLGEMSADERDVYEEHYFGCQMCGDELSATAAFVANARVALAATPTAGSQRARSGGVRRADTRWWDRLLARPQILVPAMGVAVVVLAAVASYQRLAIIPALQQQLAVHERPQGVPTVALRSAARGAGPRLQVSPSDSVAVLQADVLPERAVESYTVSLLSAGGHEQFRTSLAAPDIGVPVTLLVPLRDLPPGEYTLVFQEHPAGGDAGRFTFTLERQ